MPDFFLCMTTHRKLFVYLQYKWILRNNIAVVIIGVATDIID